MKISIITVCFNALEELKKTRESVAAQTGIQIEHIIIDGNSTDGTKDWLTHLPQNVIWRSEKDQGIYDAMNKGLSFVTGEMLLFLNAGDYIVGDILKGLTKAPGLIPVKTSRPVVGEVFLAQKSHKMGLPYCHQGIVFEKKNLKYDLNYKIAADYDFYLRHGYTQLDFLIEPNVGHVFYDNFGTSQKNASDRDREIATIIEKNFGAGAALRFRTIAAVKSLIKKCLQYDI